MKKKHIITIAGKPGSGKSSTADKLAELLGYARYSSGEIMREIAHERKIKLSELNKRAEKDASIDDAIDKRLQDMREENDVVIDSRIAFHWIPESFKVYLELDIDVAVARIYKDQTINPKRAKSGDVSENVSDMMHKIEQRINSERKRYIGLYHVDPFDPRPFDLIVDTQRHSPQTVALVIFDHYQKWLQSDRWRQAKTSVPMGYSLKNDY
jgi:cytidylate kinase